MSARRTPHRGAAADGRWPRVDDVPAPRFSRAAAGLLPLSVAAAMALTGCSSDESSGADPNRGCDPTSSAQAADLRPIELPPAHVALLEPGTGELRVPTSAPTTETPQRVTLDTKSSETSVIGNQGEAPTTTTEELSTPLTARAGCTDPKNLEFTLGAITSPDEPLNPALATFDGADGGATYADGLSPVSLRLFPPANADQPANRAIEQSLVSAFTYALPLPTEPIGVGARWRTERTVTAATTVTQEIVATLTKWEGDVLTVDIAVDETPTSTVFRIPGSASTLDLTRYANTGTGTVTVDLTRLLPTSAQLEMTGARELVGADPNRPIIQQTSLTLRWNRTD